MNVRLSSVLFRFASPPAFYDLVGRIAPFVLIAAITTTLIGLYLGLVVALPDAFQGDSFRIMYVHVPAATMATFLYVVMAGWAAIGLSFNTRVSLMMVQAIAPTGALMAFLALISGSLWGRPTWGTFWVWDARLTTTLILFIQYVGLIGLFTSIDDVRRSHMASAVMAIVGAVNLPIIYVSVSLLNTMHQGASVRLTGASMPTNMLTPLLVMLLAFWMYSAYAILLRVRSILVEREIDSAWVQRKFIRSAS